MPVIEGNIYNDVVLWSLELKKTIEYKITKFNFRTY